MKRGFVCCLVFAGQRFYGLLGQRLCEVNDACKDGFEESFAEQYGQIHRLETNKLRNVARFFAHLLYTDALQWTILGYIRLTEEETTSSSRIFIKIMLQEIAENLGLTKFNERLQVTTTLEIATRIPSSSTHSCCLSTAALC